MSEKYIGKAYARLGLMGNPADAIGGVAVQTVMKEYWAESILEPSSRLRLIEPESENPDWENLEGLIKQVNSIGYYGGRRLMMALIHRIVGYGRIKKIKIPDKNFNLHWKTSIPPRVGLAGSSALLTSALQCILAYWEIEIPLIEKVEMVLNTERENLGIPAGPMDRVAQVYEGLTYFERGADGHLKIERLNSQNLPPLFVAINENTSEGTEVFHSNLRARFEQGDPDVLEGVEQLKSLARKCRDLLSAGKGSEIGPLMNENFMVRKRLVKLNPRHIQMVENAWKAGAYAKFAGSGGAIVGTCSLDKMESVLEKLRGCGYIAFQPHIQEPEGS